MDTFRPVYQFRITLRYITPRIWRRIQISDLATFWDLHAAIQDAMGWSDEHLHQFNFPDKLVTAINIGIPRPDYPDDMQILASWDERLSDYFTEKDKKCHYEYDFGDRWEHSIVFEGIHERELDISYPRCLGGKNACPPENVGGWCCFQNFVEIMKNNQHKEYQEMLEWYGRVFDPKEFSLQDVVFVSHDDWKEHFKRVVGLH